MGESRARLNTRERETGKGEANGPKKRGEGVGEKGEGEEGKQMCLPGQTGLLLGGERFTKYDHGLNKISTVSVKKANRYHRAYSIARKWLNFSGGEGGRQFPSKKRQHASPAWWWDLVPPKPYPSRKRVPRRECPVLRGNEESGESLFLCNPTLS